MKKILLNKIFMLSIILLITEVLNFIVFSFLNFLAIAFKSYIPNDIFENRDVIIAIILMFVSLIMYYFIGKKIFINFGNDKIKKYSAIITSVIIIVSYPVSEFVTQILGEYFIVHMIVCSPIAYFIAMPFATSEINHLYENILALLSPISVLLIYIVALKYKNKSRNNS